MKYIHKILILSSLLVYMTSCNRDIDPGKVETIGYDKISKIELSVNSPVLDADGKSELRFKVRCYYKYKDSIYPMLEDRIPMEEINVYSSSGERFNINEVFTTNIKPNNGFVDFHCKLKDNISNTVSVRVIDPKEEDYTPIVIPVQVYVLYDETTKNSIENINEETVQKLLDRTNDVFAGKLVNAPSSCDAKISFKLTEIKKIKEKVDAYSVNDYIKNNMMEGTDDNFTIWIAKDFGWYPRMKDCIPQYTLGNPDDIPGLKLEKKDSFEEVKNSLESADASDIITAKGLIVTYYNFYKMLNYNIKMEDRFEKVIARAYGLLETGYHNPKESSNYVDGDIDYCPDTFTYTDKFILLTKFVFIPDTQEDKTMNYYDSFNIMDKYSTATTITRDQIKRIRQVIKDCPYRQMQLK